MLMRILQIFDFQVNYVLDLWFHYRDGISFNDLFTRWKCTHILDLRPLKVKYTQYGICSQAAFKNARAMFFSFSGGFGKIPGGGRNFAGAAPARIRNPYKFVGGSLASPFEQGVDCIISQLIKQVVPRSPNYFGF